MPSAIRCCFIVFLFITLLLLSTISQAQVSNLVLTRIGIEDGLSQVSALALAQDQRGYVWIGTENGVDIYDGYRVYHLLGPDKDFNKYTVNSINVDSNGIIWIALYGKGLYTYNPETNEYQLIIKSIEQDEEQYIWLVAEDTKNEFYWLATESSVLGYDAKSKAIIHQLDLSPYFTVIDTIYGIKVVKNWLIISTRAGLFIYDIAKDKLTPLPAIKNEDFPNSTFDNSQAAKIYDVAYIDGQLFIATNDGVFYLSEQDLISYLKGQQSKLNYIEAIANVAVWQLEFDQNILYATTTTGLYHFNIKTKQSAFLFRFSQYNQKTADNDIVSLVIDDKGLLWLGSDNSGIYIWDPNIKHITTFTYENNKTNSLSNNNVTSITAIPTRKDELWVGTNNGLNLVNLKTQEVIQYLYSANTKTSYTKGYIYQTEFDHLGRLWLVTAKGVFWFDPQSKRLLTPDFPNSTMPLMDVQESVPFILSIGKHIWLTKGKNLYKIHALTGKVTKFSSLAEQIGNRYIWNLLPSFSGKENEILIATVDRLWLFDGDTQTLTSIYKHEDVSRDSYGYIDHWAKDSKGLIWLTFTQVGVIAIDAKTYQLKYFYNEHNSILDVNNYGIEVDKNDNVWLSSNSGIFRIDATTRHMRRFTNMDGLSGLEFNYNAFAHLSDGRLAYGGAQGISIFDPLMLGDAHQNINNNVSIVKVNTLSRDIDLPLIIPNNYMLSLNHDDFVIRLDFSDFSYGGIQKSTFKYGFVDGVSFPETKQNYVVFPRLSPGDYQFKVQAKSAITGEYSDPAFIRLKVSYPQWQSPVAITCYVIFLVICLWLWLWRRQLRQKELLALYGKVKSRNNRLQLALTGSNSDVWDWKASQNSFFSSRVINDLGYAERGDVIAYDAYIELIHSDDRDNFVYTWQQFISVADVEANFECHYRLKTVRDEWLWYKDLGKIVAVDESGESSRVTGTYTNITESKAIQERAQYYGAAFEQTRDWVLIFDESFTKAHVNRSISDVFGWKEKILDLTKESLGINHERLQYYRELVPAIDIEGHWRGEEVITTPQGSEYHVITHISISVDKKQQRKHYICVYTDITAQKLAESELRVMANYDHLTGLANRTLLLDRIEHAIASSNRSKMPIALLFIDLDKFKQVNDSLGHEYGDTLLKEGAKRLKESLRADDTLARIGGDEFVVLLERFRSTSELGNIAQKYIDILQQPFTLNNNVVSIGASVGIAIYPDDANSSKVLFRHADAAMYHAKQLGRNNFQFFTKHMNQTAKERLTKETNIKLALANDEFFNVYQPIVNANTKKAVGAEMLLRWRHNEAIIPPIEFISLSEELGLIAAITEQAMNKAFNQLVQWRESQNDFYLSVNLSAAHFCDSNLPYLIQRLLSRYSLPPNSIKLEVTESAFMQESDKAIELMKALSKIGISLALDDFGTGFSSLTYLKKLPLDIIKIDRSFVVSIGIEQTDEAIIDTTLVLAKKLDKYCIAEGVETKAQLKYFLNRGCHLIQGYLFYKPLTAQALTDRLNDGWPEIMLVTVRSDRNGE